MLLSLINYEINTSTKHKTFLRLKSVCISILSRTSNLHDLYIYLYTYPLLTP